MPLVPKTLIVLGLAVALSGITLMILSWTGYVVDLGIGIATAYVDAAAILTGTALVGTGASLLNRLPPSQMSPPN